MVMDRTEQYTGIELILRYFVCIGIDIELIF